MSEFYSSIPHEVVSALFGALGAVVAMLSNVFLRKFIGRQTNSAIARQEALELISNWAELNAILDIPKNRRSLHTKIMSSTLVNLVGSRVPSALEKTLREQSRLENPRQDEVDKVKEEFGKLVRKYSIVSRNFGGRKA